MPCHRMILCVEKKYARILYRSTTVIEFKKIDFPKIFSTFIKMHFVYDIDYPLCFVQILSLFRQLLFDEKPNDIRKVAVYLSVY